MSCCGGGEIQPALVVVEQESTSVEKELDLVLDLTDAHHEALATTGRGPHRGRSFDLGKFDVDHLGDGVMALPAVNALRALGPLPLLRAHFLI